jgi:hypothetical protein
MIGPRNLLVLASADFWLTELPTVQASTGDLPYRARVITHTNRPWLLRSLVGDLVHVVRHGWSKAFSRVTVQVDVVLYPPDAAVGALPIIVVPVQPDAPVQRVRRGDVVLARGRAVPGHAMVLTVDGTTIPCAGPAWVPTLFRRRLRL